MNQPSHPMDTIFALATAPGRAGVAVIRLSGPKALPTLMQLTRKETPPKMRELLFSTLYDPATKQPIDHAMTVYFQAPNSFTGEDCVELHLHGSPIIIERIYSILARQPGVRLANQGEFTRRAFEYGKLDLTEAEAIADLVDAETEAQRIQALRQLSGALGALYQSWGDQLKKILAHQEAMIDFSEEELPEAMNTQMFEMIQALICNIESHLTEGHRGEKIRDGIFVSILGAPNAGKSTFLNQLAQKEIAIVTDVPGTTRDVIEIKLDIAGYPVLFADTAGLRETKDLVESIGVERAIQRAASADYKLFLFDGTAPYQALDAFAPADAKSIFLINKEDQGPCTWQANLKKCYPEYPIFKISAKSGTGVQAFLSYLGKMLKREFRASDLPHLTRFRHREALEKTQLFLTEAAHSKIEDLRAESLRSAMHQLGCITGRVNVEGLLDVIFKDFCIGK